MKQVGNYLGFISVYGPEKYNLKKISLIGKNNIGSRIDIKQVWQTVCTLHGKNDLFF